MEQPQPVPLALPPAAAQPPCLLAGEFGPLGYLAGFFFLLGLVTREALACGRPLAWSLEAAPRRRPPAGYRVPLADGGSDSHGPGR